MGSKKRSSWSKQKAEFAAGLDDFSGMDDIFAREEAHRERASADTMRRRVAARHASRRTVMLRVRRPKKILRGVSIMASAVCLFTGVPTAMVGISRRIPGMNNASFIALVLYRLKSDARHRAHRFFIGASCLAEPARRNVPPCP